MGNIVFCRHLGVGKVEAENGNQFYLGSCLLNTGETRGFHEGSKRDRFQTNEYIDNLPTYFPGFWAPPKLYQFHVSHEKYPGWLGHIGHYTTQLRIYIGIIINHYKDPY